ncbi:MAG TPA: nuclear transport factor 2 family protein, partial [Terriglobia bacterium]|nr:nuclear transport factor 2 family protein [Terriglobia bacterium]
MEIIRVLISKRNAAILAAIVAFSSAALGQSAGHKPSMSKAKAAKIAEEVSILDHVWLDAARNRDTGTMAWLFSDGFVEVHPGGQIVNKAQQIAQITNLANENLTLYPSDIQLRYISPDVAVMTDITHIAGEIGPIKYN